MIQIQLILLLGLTFQSRIYLQLSSFKQRTKSNLDTFKYETFSGQVDFKNDQKLNIIFDTSQNTNWVYQLDSFQDCDLKDEDCYHHNGFNNGKNSDCKMTDKSCYEKKYKQEKEIQYLYKEKLKLSGYKDFKIFDKIMNIYYAYYSELKYYQIDGLISLASFPLYTIFLTDSNYQSEYNSQITFGHIDTKLQMDGEDVKYFQMIDKQPKILLQDIQIDQFDQKNITAKIDTKVRGIGINKENVIYRYLVQENECKVNDKIIYCNCRSNLKKLIFKIKGIDNNSYQFILFKRDYFVNYKFRGQCQTKFQIFEQDLILGNAFIMKYYTIINNLENKIGLVKAKNQKNTILKLLLTKQLIVFFIFTLALFFLGIFLSKLIIKLIYKKASTQQTLQLLS